MLPTITVVGNLKRIETRFLPSGKQLTKFQIECAEKGKDDKWTNLYLSGECWEQQAKFVEQYFKDGSPAIVTGKLFTNVYENQAGIKVYENKLLFPSVSFVPKDKSDNQQQGYQNNQSQQEQPQVNHYDKIPEIDIKDDQIPF
jgi:single-stranded DNA-binding protein